MMYCTLCGAIPGERIGQCPGGSLANAHQHNWVETLKPVFCKLCGTVPGKPLGRCPGGGLANAHSHNWIPLGGA